MKQLEVTTWVRRKVRDRVMTDITLLLKPLSSEKYTSSKTEIAGFLIIGGAGMQLAHCGVIVFFSL